jgi:pimeloyl-ACP methyl ester carboxylesterase
MKMEFFNRNYGVICYEDTGGLGIPVICVPGMGDLYQEYRFLTPILKETGYRVITMDLRGHGGSSTDWDDYSPEAVGSDILELMRHLHIDSAILVGTSFAVASAVWAAGTSPQNVLALVLIGPFVRDIPRNFVQNLMMQLLFAGPWKVEAWSAFYASLYTSKKPADFGSYQKQLKENLSEKGRFDALVKMIYASKSQCEKQIPNVQAPSLTIMGTKDPDFKDPRQEAEYVARKLSGNYLMVDGAGHYPHVEEAQLVGNKIVNFLAKVREKSQV